MLIEESLSAINQFLGGSRQGFPVSIATNAQHVFVKDAGYLALHEMLLRIVPEKEQTGIRWNDSALSPGRALESHQNLCEVVKPLRPPAPGRTLTQVTLDSLLVDVIERRIAHNLKLPIA
jgi:hypothetical protein